MTYLLFEGMYVIPEFLGADDGSGTDATTAAVLQNIAQLHPAVALGGGLTAIVSNGVAASPASSFAWNVATRSLVFLFVEFGVFFGVLLHLEHTDSSGTADSCVRARVSVCVCMCVCVRACVWVLVHASPVYTSMDWVVLRKTLCSRLCGCVVARICGAVSLRPGGGQCGSRVIVPEHPNIEDDDVHRERERVTQSEETLATLGEPGGVDGGGDGGCGGGGGNHAKDDDTGVGGGFGRGILRFFNVRKVFPPKMRGGPVNVAVADLCLDV